MGKQKILMVSFLVGQVAVCHAAVTMISKTHTVWGDAGYGDNQNTYYDSSHSPVSGYVDGYGIDGSWGHATSTANEWGVSAYRGADAWSANAYAQNTYIFSPLENTLSVSVSGAVDVWWFENDAKMMLTDLTTGTLIGSYYSPSYTWWKNPFGPEEDDMQTYYVSWERNIIVNPLNEYMLTLYVGAHRGEGGDGAASLSVNFFISDPAAYDPYVIPAPGAIVLAGIGASMVGWLRRRRAL